MKSQKQITRNSFVHLVKFYLVSMVVPMIEFLYTLKRKILRQPLFDESKLHKDLSNCVCLITGSATGGIGRNMIKQLAESKCYLIITVRGSQEYVVRSKSNLIRNELKGVDPTQYRFEYVDMDSFDSIIRLTKKLNDSRQKINFVIFNAGIAFRNFRITENGFEHHLQTNYLSGCLLLIGLLPLLVSTARLAERQGEPKSKIVFNSSCTHKMASFDLDPLDYAANLSRDDFSTHQMYPLTKLYQIMFNNHLFDQIIKKTSPDSICLINAHPGIVDTGVSDETYLKKYLPFIYKIGALMMKSGEEGATNVTIPIRSDDEIFNNSECVYLEELKPCLMSNYCYDEELKEKLYLNTLSLLAKYIKQFDLPYSLNPLEN